MRCQTRNIGPSVSTMSPSKSKMRALITDPVFGSQVALEELQDPALHVGAIRLGARHMPLIRIEQRFEPLPCIDQGLHHSGGVTEVDVLVDHAVDQHQLSL